MLTQEELDTARYCLDKAMELGAEKARVSMSKDVSDIYSFLNGELDKVTHAADRTVYFIIGAVGKHCSFATNRLDRSEIDELLRNALESVNSLEEDRFWKLPEKERLCTDAKDGDELRLYDPEYDKLTAETRLRLASSCSLFNLNRDTGKDWKIISEETEYGDSCEDTYLINSDGAECRQRSTGYSCSCEITIEDAQGCKYSGFWWSGPSRIKDADFSKIPDKALKKAVAKINPVQTKGGVRNMVVDSMVSSRLLSPVITALSGSSLQQKNSFLCDSMGKKHFCSGMTVRDIARATGRPGSRLFDAEGVATEDRTIIEKGQVNFYFLNTYYSGKMGLPPTVDSPSGIVLEPWNSVDENKLLNLRDILALCRDGIYVTDFNGGNCNPVTGDFSYGIEGFEIENGTIGKPVRGMLMTGNMTDLWNRLIAAGNDAREDSSWLVPTLAFSGINFSS